jgi:hypothetical protein
MGNSQIHLDICRPWLSFADLQIMFRWEQSFGELTLAMFSWEMLNWRPQEMSRKPP